MRAAVATTTTALAFAPAAPPSVHDTLVQAAARADGVLLDLVEALEQSRAPGQIPDLLDLAQSTFLRAQDPLVVADLEYITRQLHVLHTAVVRLHGSTVAERVGSPVLG